MYLIFELPPRRELRHTIGKADEETGVPFQSARPNIKYFAEQLWADPVVLIVPIRESSDSAGLAIVLEPGLDDEVIAEAHRQPVYPRLPGPEELRPRCRVVADILFEEEVDRVAQPPGNPCAVRDRE